MKAKEERFFTIRDVQRILVCIAAGTVMAVNLRTFVHTGGLLPGGIAGLTVLVQGIFQRFVGMDVPYGRLYLALNTFPILLAVRKIGKKFTAYSCITIGVVTILTEILPTTTPSDFHLWRDYQRGRDLDGAPGRSNDRRDGLCRHLSV